MYIILIVKGLHTPGEVVREGKEDTSSTGLSLNGSAYLNIKRSGGLTKEGAENSKITKQYMVRSNAKRDASQHLAAKQGESDANNLTYALVFFWGRRCALPPMLPPPAPLLCLAKKGAKLECCVPRAAHQ